MDFGAVRLGEGRVRPVRADEESRENEFVRNNR